MLCVSFVWLVLFILFMLFALLGLSVVFGLFVVLAGLMSVSVTPVNQASES